MSTTKDRGDRPEGYSVGTSASPVKTRSTRTVNIAVGIVVAVVAVGLVVAAVLSSGRVDTNAKPPTGVTALGDPVALGSGAITVDLWEDFQCPACGQFERGFPGQLISKALDEGRIQLRVHVLSFLDRGKVAESTRAANASFCAADQGRFKEFHDWAYANQPAEYSGGYTTEILTTSAGDIGITDTATFSQCVADLSYRSHAAALNERMLDDNVGGTPTIRVNGEELDLQTLTEESLTRALGLG